MSVASGGSNEPDVVEPETVPVSEGGHELPSVLGGGPPADMRGIGRRKLSRPSKAIIIAACTVVALVVGAAVGIPAAIEAAKPKTDAILLGYFTALADGDGEAALTYVGGMIPDMADATLLTDAVAAASVATNPITNIEVGTPELDEDRPEVATVPISYRIGDTEVSRTYLVEQPTESYPNGAVWDAAEVIRVTLPQELSPTVNGVPGGDGELHYVFPGSYTWAIDHPNFTLSMREPTFTVGAAEDADRMAKLTFGLSPNAKQTARDLATEALTACVPSRALVTPCGLMINESTAELLQPVDGSFVRTMDTDTTADVTSLDFEPIVGGEPFLYNAGTISVGVTYTPGVVTIRYKTGPIETRASSYPMTFDFTSEDITFEWYTG